METFHVATVLICGSRRLDPQKVKDRLIILYDQATPSLEEGWPDMAFDETNIIHGNAKGADAGAQLFAEHFGFPVTRFSADWNSQGKAAGPIRNKRMLDEGKPDFVVAFWDGKSKGTLNMITQAAEAGVPVFIHGTEGLEIPVEEPEKTSTLFD